MNANEIYQNLLTTWNELERAQRLRIAVTAAALALLTIVLFAWTLSSNYQVLFADLEPRDAAAIVDELKRSKVPYRLADGGSKILVEDKRVHETRLSLMGRGVPLSGGVGFEIFDNKDIGMTEYTQRINYQRALQGELARTMMSIEHVKQARVHLVVPESSLFRRQQVKPKASVSLVLKPGARLSGDQIVGIQRLVAASVPGLDAGAVTVLDQGGVTLSAAIDGDENVANASGKLKLKRNTEEYFLRKISDVLDRTYGPGQAIVSVDVDLNFDEVKRTAQTIIPVRTDMGEESGAVVRKRQSTHRQPRGAIKTADGDATAYTGTTAETTSTTDVEYEIGKSIEQVVSSPGGIRRISVGVIVPKMSPEQIQRIQGIVSMIVGFNTARGDAITVQPLNQMVSEITDAGPESAAAANVMDGGTIAGKARQVMLDQKIWLALLALLIVLGGVFAWRWRATRSPSSGELSKTEREARLAEIRAWLDAERSAGQPKEPA